MERAPSRSDRTCAQRLVVVVLRRRRRQAEGSTIGWPSASARALPMRDAGDEQGPIPGFSGTVVWLSEQSDPEKMSELAITTMVIPRGS